MTTREFERMQRLNMLKSLCFEDHALYSWTFEKDNGKNPIMWVARDYVDKWSDALSGNTGLVLWGDVGTGKTFFAACIANALVEQHVSVKMTNFSTILNDLFTESEKNKYLNRLNDHSLLIIDDLCFVPLTEDNRLTAKEILGNRAKLSKWQDEFHEFMAKFYPEIERGTSATLTNRKHIPSKSAEKCVNTAKAVQP